MAVDIDLHANPGEDKRGESGDNHDDAGEIGEIGKLLASLLLVAGDEGQEMFDAAREPLLVKNVKTKTEEFLEVRNEEGHRQPLRVFIANTSSQSCRLRLENLTTS